MQSKVLFVTLIMLVAAPIGAEVAPLRGEERHVVVQEFDLGEAKELLNDLFRRGVDLLKNHLELEGALSDAGNGEQSGRFALRFYARGKGQSLEHVTAESQFTIDESGVGLRFDFRFQKEAGTSIPSSDDYI
jgi:hypothetical protein